MEKNGKQKKLTKVLMIILQKKNNNANRSNIVKNNQKESNHTLICNDIKQAIDVSVRPSKEKCDISSSTNLLHKK